MKQEFCKHFPRETHRALYADSYGCQSFAHKLIFLPPRIEQVTLLHYVTQGTGTLTIDGKTFELKSGALFYCPSGTSITYHSSIDDPYAYYWITFGGEEALALMNECGFTPGSPVKYPSGGAEIEKLMSALIDADASGMKTLSVLYSVLDYAQQRESAPLPDYAQKAREILQLNFADPNLRISDVARALHLSPEYLSKVFSESTGNTAKAYLTELRLTNAAALLASGTSVTVAAENSGYYDPALFSRTFKARFGVSPKRYR